MTTTARIRLTATLALLAALVAALLAGLPTSAPGSSQTVLTTGVLRDASGNPTTGTVRVYAWPNHDEALSLPLVGQAQTDSAGNFTVYAADDAQLAQLAQQRRGWLDFIAVGDAPSHQGQWAFTSYIANQGGAVQSMSPAAVTAAPSARAAALRRPAAPRIAITANRRQPLAGTSARAAQSSRCVSEYQVQKPRSVPKLAIVGELNNAYNDGTRAKFSYGRENSADSEFGVALSGDSGESFTIGGENHVGNGASVTWPTISRRYARKLRSKFEFTREAARTNTCAKWDVLIRATSWLTGGDDSLKQSAALDKCDSSYAAKQPSGYKFHRDTNNAVRWTRGVEAFGVYLTARSGFSRNVTLDYAWGGPAGKAHYLCGPNGKESPATAGRVFSGTAK